MYANKYHNQDLSKLSFLVTGGAGFIGSNLVEYLLKYGAGKVRVLDNFSTGFLANLSRFEGDSAFELIEGDIRDLQTCRNAARGIDHISHQAALGSVPRSIKDPITTNEVNVSGFLNMLCAARDEGTKRFVYAASSSTYGNSAELPKIEDRIGQPLSPYAVTKLVNELYAGIFAKTYDLETIGLRYFNVFGPGQSPAGEYAAVIPLFIKAVAGNEPAFINGDGTQTRDFTFVENAVQANIKAMLIDNAGAINQVYNVACGERTSLNDLWKMINQVAGKDITPLYRDKRNGDILDSLADLSKIKKHLSYEPLFSVSEGLYKTYEWLTHVSD